MPLSLLRLVNSGSVTIQFFPGHLIVRHAVAPPRQFTSVYVPIDLVLVVGVYIAAASHYERLVL
jgi:ABC-type transport system involved in cytochrome bd biosynthesis fused ATPase/permease subunit